METDNYDELDASHDAIADALHACDALMDKLDELIKSSVGKAQDEAVKIFEKVNDHHMALCDIAKRWGA